MTDTSPDLLREAEDEVRHLVADESWVGAVEVDARHLRAWLSELERLRARDAAATAVVPTIRAALENAPQQCRYHGDDFERAGMQWGKPRCESCRQPWRVVQALRALDELARAHRGGQT